MSSQSEKAHTLSTLHSSGTFIVPNFWDPGSARILERMGFQALASTSAGFAQSIGTLDGNISLEAKLEHIAAVCAVTEVPVTVDFENGFADSPEACAAHLMRLVEAGAAGASIEDWSGSEIYPQSLASERIAACAEALTQLDFPFALTARAENLLRGHQSLSDTLARLSAYEAAGADVLYAPGLASVDQIQAVLDVVNKPINVLSPFLPDLPFAEYETLGVRRISVGGALMNYVLAGLLGGAAQMLEEGDFSWATQGVRGSMLKDLLSS